MRTFWIYASNIRHRIYGVRYLGKRIESARASLPADKGMKAKMLLAAVSKPLGLSGLKTVL